ncbi:DUF3606 domain-containing protein [Methylobacterium sp. NEAU 140]|uniref:DUF3606 domain-containing protein n=1 Tax=Methylobacterium sp. NEAU 140 TaxID=3064945 RepID=UPI0027376797|nr:DUF3606 domain-containing protein [Methylobacterium sp. NEAU 140]MDP4027192.1 DUF3606 domain-containing protein [Methylobacterium sp. NEAU 140]
MSDLQSIRPERTHLDVWDRAARSAFAARIGVSDEKLRKSIRMVGSRITTLSSHLKI